MTNLETYQRRDIVEWYGKFQEVCGAEQAIFDRVKEKFPTLSMLDIGVGGGRTTAVFADQCSSYLGLDYAANMVELCERRFPQFKFMQADARDLRSIPDKSFDYVLFSFNGIDEVSYEDRAKVFSEVRRVCRGYFAFSTHNLLYAPIHFSWNPSGNPLKYLVRFALLRLMNAPLRKKFKDDYALFNDGVHRFGLSIYYIRPERQIRDLEEAGFSEIRVFERGSGKELTGEPILDPHPYFLTKT